MSLTGFTSPLWFLLLLAVVVLLAGYLVVQRMRRRNTMRFTNLALLEKVAPRRQGLARHVPTALFLVALTCLTIALAGPTSEQKVPRNRATVILAVDVSLSMESTDVEPSRLKAAQTAAKQFVDGLTPGVNLGVVAFAGTATVLVSPTVDRSAPKAAIDNLKLAERTATGEAIFTSLQAIDTMAAVVPGAEPPPARIVLLSDGAQTVPEFTDDPRGSFTAAGEAAKKKIPVSTISFGTRYGTVDIEGRRQPVPVDDASMRQIARLAGGDFYTASSLADLNAVYDTLEKQIGYETLLGDASRPWLILGTVLALLSAGTGLVLTQRLP
ncbi:VWA domain-containing protein [Rhodococcus sp. X156]|uniref:VWA domain-containing protein n=1 Tax=Rhodococcus sp. X156 TaxID=2499145 RepID=UPI000FDB3F56|nr:VWA domain-containing protein [Rhodococcus sp. X156]